MIINRAAIILVSNWTEETIKILMTIIKSCTNAAILPTAEYQSNLAIIYKPISIIAISKALTASFLSSLEIVDPILL